MELLPVNVENEHKYLMKNMPKANPSEILHIIQWYGQYQGENVRLRKIIAEGSSATKYEFIKKVKTEAGKNLEHQILVGMPTQDQVNDFVKKATRQIMKTRHIFPTDAGKFEVDVFNTVHLIIGELEVAVLEDVVTLPDFIQNEIIMEVTYLSGFSNYDLAETFK